MARRRGIKVTNSLLFRRASCCFLALLAFCCYYYYHYYYSHGLNARVNSDSRGDAHLSLFCHSDPYLDFRSYPDGTISSENCYYGNINGRGIIGGKGGIGVELPAVSSSVLRRCRENPFHAFYDCLWPLIHYLSTCASRESPDRHTLIVSGSSSSSTDSLLRFTGDGSWLEGAFAAILRGLSNIGIETLQVVEKKEEHNLYSPVCFSSVVRFLPDANWRPLRYNADFSGAPNKSASTTSSSVAHPERMKAAGLQLFRKLVTSSFFVEGRSKRKKKIIVYDRGDARRRRWTNGFDFAWKLNATLGDAYEVIYLWKMPRTFEEQVELHVDAAGLIAPHGASFANSLFMPRDAVLLEIASRNCNGDIDIDEKAEDGWTVWHASKLELNYLAIGCTIALERGMALKTDNAALLKITSALLRVQEQALGLPN